MTACTRLSDRIPEVASGRTRWTAEEAAHLANCPDCLAEWNLVGATIRIGTKSPIPRDPDAIAGAVLQRLAEDRRSRRSWRAWGAGIAAAAAIAGVIWAGRQPRQVTQPPSERVEIVLPELEPLETAELDSLLETMDAPQVGSSALDEPSLGDLDAKELEQVLGTWEG
jgi:hypothetical protein